MEESKEILSYGQISNDSGSIHLCSNGGVMVEYRRLIEGCILS